MIRQIFARSPGHLVCALGLAMVSCEPQLAPTPVEDTRSSGPKVSPFEEAPQAEEPVTGKKQASIHGLLVARISEGEVAGSASRMNATVVDEDFGAGLSLGFNQEVGKSTESSLEEVEKFHAVRRGSEPVKKAIDISFGEQYSQKDGPSAAVACALLVESILTGVELDGAFAVTGDMAADGTVRAVGGIDGKIRGATKGKCSIIAIPADNRETLSDLAVLKETKYFTDIQIFSIATFDDALELAKAENGRSDVLKQSIAAFAEIQKVLSQPGGEKWIGNPHVQERLKKIVQDTPNHESARHLYLIGARATAPQLSLAGSFLQIYRVVAPIRSALETGNIPDDTKGLGDSIFSLRNVRTVLDPRTRGCADALEDFAEKLKKVGDTDLASAQSRIPKFVAELNESWDRVVEEYREIQSDPEIQEELNR